jgi:ESCRT-II complex subunit VPS22
MCTAIGVDPLASSSGASGKDGGGSFWAQLLGNSVNDFYFELAVRVVEVCGATREENGGLIGVKEVKDRIMSTRMEGGAEITEYVFAIDHVVFKVLTNSVMIFFEQLPPSNL